MRIVANWLADTMTKESAKVSLSNITKILSPLHLAQLVETPSVSEKDKFLICKDLSENALKFISTSGEELSDLAETAIEENRYPKLDLGIVKPENDTAYLHEKNLVSILRKVKSVENKFNYFHQIERLKEYPVFINNESEYLQGEQKGEVLVENGRHNLNHLLNKVKEIHRPDVFDIIKKYSFKRKKLDIRIPTPENLHFRTLRNQFQIDTILAKHISIVSISDILVVETEEEYSQFAHILSALEVDTQIILAKDFQNGYNKIISSIPESKITFVQQLLSLIKNKNWIEIHENCFNISMQEPFLGFFNHAVLIKSANEANQLILSNVNGGFSLTEKKAIEKYINSFLKSELTQKANWQVKNLHLTLDTSNGGKLIINFL